MIKRLDAKLNNKHKQCKIYATLNSSFCNMFTSLSSFDYFALKKLKLDSEEDIIKNIMAYAGYVSPALYSIGNMFAIIHFMNRWFNLYKEKFQNHVFEGIDYNPFYTRYLCEQILIMMPETSLSTDYITNCCVVKDNKRYRLNIGFRIRNNYDTLKIIDSFVINFKCNGKMKHLFCGFMYEQKKNPFYIYITDEYYKHMYEVCRKGSNKEEINFQYKDYKEEYAGMEAM